MLILGAIEIRRRTSLPGLHACLASIRYWNPTAALVLFSRSPADPVLTGLLARHAITEIIPCPPDAWGVGTGRFVDYGLWLDTQPIGGDVVMIDLLDVVAQGLWSPLRPGVFEERIRIDQCPFNRTWIPDAFPDRYAELAHQTVICCGAIVGTGAWTRDYLAAYTEDLHSRGDLVPGGFDTAFLNVYARENPARTRVVPYLNPDIMHIGYAPGPSVQYEAGTIRIEHQSPRAVHQYNRHRHVTKPVHRRWG